MQKPYLLRLLKNIALLALPTYLTSCVNQPKLPDTLGDQNTSYNYIPLDPLPIEIQPSKACAPQQLQTLLSSLPDQAVRIAVAQLDANGKVKFGPVGYGEEKHSYQVILDYISVDATRVPIRVSRVASRSGAKNYNLTVHDHFPKEPTNYTVYPDIDSDLVTKNAGTNKEQLEFLNRLDKVIVPVYVGVGLRLTANVNVIKGNANLTSLAAIAADAEAGKLNGTLTVQTLGITGKTISTALPLPSEVNQTTVQNAILSLGAIKAVLYDKDNTIVTPRVVGIYNPIGGGQQVVDGIVSVLAKDPVKWVRPCIYQ